MVEEGNGERQDGRNLVKEWLTHKRNIDCDADLSWSEEGNGERQDGRNLVKEWLTHKRNIDCDAEYVTTRAELLAIDTERTDYLMGE
ncbi:hypothetical protein J6590_019510 [Homalodisca vitripennis]|nr:hypothetical protein J6590_019510 [Homalodisca vitripennis]